MGLWGDQHLIIITHRRHRRCCGRRVVGRPRWRHGDGGVGARHQGVPDAHAPFPSHPPPTATTMLGGSGGLKMGDIPHNLFSPIPRPGSFGYSRNISEIFKNVKNIIKAQQKYIKSVTKYNINCYRSKGDKCQCYSILSESLPGTASPTFSVKRVFAKTKKKITTFWNLP